MEGGCGKGGERERERERERARFARTWHIPSLSRAPRRATVSRARARSSREPPPTPRPVRPPHAWTRGESKQGVQRPKNAYSSMTSSLDLSMVDHALEPVTR